MSKSVTRKYLFGGLVVGLLVGLLISGPNFHVWPASTSLAVMVGCTALGAFIGSFVVAFVVNSAIGGSGLASDGSNDHHGFNVPSDHHDSSGGDGHGPGDAGSV